jgi:hypothetical protein
LPEGKIGPFKRMPKRGMDSCRLHALAFNYLDLLFSQPVKRRMVIIEVKPNFEINACGRQRWVLAVAYLSKEGRPSPVGAMFSL